MNKNEGKSQNSVGLFKVEAHLKYLQDVARSYLCPCPSIFDGSISSRRVLTQKVIDDICREKGIHSIQMHVFYGS